MSRRSLRQKANASVFEFRASRSWFRGSYRGLRLSRWLTPGGLGKRGEWFRRRFGAGCHGKCEGLSSRTVSATPGLYVSGRTVRRLELDESS